MHVNACMRSAMDEPGASLYDVLGMSFTDDINSLPILFIMLLWDHWDLDVLCVYYVCTVCFVTTCCFFEWNGANGLIENKLLKMTTTEIIKLTKRSCLLLSRVFISIWT